MSLLQNWRDIAYNQEADKKQLQQFWTNYFLIEKNIYEQLLSNPDEVVKGTVKELAEKYKVDVMTMVGFLDGINDSLVIPNPIEEMEEDTVVTLAYDKELLYKNMVDAKADWLYNLPMWDEIFTEEQKKTLYMEQKKSGTVIKGKKIGRNDPCPCGSGKLKGFAVFFSRKREKQDAGDGSLSEKNYTAGGRKKRAGTGTLAVRMGAGPDGNAGTVWAGWRKDNDRTECARKTVPAGASADLF